MLFRPEYGGLTYTLQVIIEAIDFILRLRFCQVRIMNPDNIGDFRVDCEHKIKEVKCKERAEDCRP